MPQGVSVLIPAYNEANNIAATVKALEAIDKVRQIIVINDGSTDETIKIIRQLQIEYVDLKQNLGKGGALNSALKLVDFDLLALADADLGITAIEFDKLIKPVWNDKADMTIARFPDRDNKSGCGLVFFLAQYGIELLTGKKYKTPLSGQRVLSKRAIECITEFASGFAVETDLTIKLNRVGLKIIEVPVEMRHDRTTKDLQGFYHRGKQFKDILKTLLLELKRC